jgi:hypothetical protein
LRIGFVFTADAAATQDLAVDAQFAELVDDDRNAPAIGVLQNVAQQRGLAAAQKAGNDGGGDLGCVLGQKLLCSEEKKAAASVPAANEGGGAVRGVGDVRAVQRQGPRPAQPQRQLTDTAEQPLRATGRG